MHNISRHPYYRSWQQIIQRCTNPNHRSYHRYGGRGITVCQRWIDGLANFLEDMGERPPNMTLDRIDNDGNYEPSNCRWATRKEQANNRSPKSTFDKFIIVGTIRKHCSKWILWISMPSPGKRVARTFNTREEAEEFQMQVAYEREFQRQLKHLHLDSSSGLLISKASG